jgi:hypothetical protein
MFSLPAYCDGSPVTFQNLAFGPHKFTIVHASNDETIPLVFSWKNISPKLIVYRSELEGKPTKRRKK